MRQLASTPNTGGSACPQADVESPKAQEEIPGDRAAVSNALRTMRSTYHERKNGIATLDLSARPISF